MESSFSKRNASDMEYKDYEHENLRNSTMQGNVIIVMDKPEEQVEEETEMEEVMDKKQWIQQQQQQQQQQNDSTISSKSYKNNKDYGCYSCEYTARKSGTTIESHEYEYDLFRDFNYDDDSASDEEPEARLGRSPTPTSYQTRNRTRTWLHRNMRRCCSKKTNVPIAFELILSFLLFQAAILFVALTINGFSAAASGMGVTLNFGSVRIRNSSPGNQVDTVDMISECRIQIAMAASKAQTQEARAVLETRIDAMCSNRVMLLPTFNDDDEDASIPGPGSIASANMSAFLQTAEHNVPTIIVVSTANLGAALNITRERFDVEFIEKSVAIIVLEQSRCDVIPETYMDLHKAFKVVMTVTKCDSILKYNFPRFWAITPSQFSMLDEKRKPPVYEYLHDAGFFLTHQLHHQRKDWVHERPYSYYRDDDSDDATRFMDVIARIEATPLLSQTGVIVDFDDRRCVNAKIALCPGGYVSPEFWHAVECGSIPVLHRSQSAMISSAILPQNLPFIFVDSWEQLAYLIPSQFTRHLSLDEKSVNLEIWKVNLWDSVDYGVRAMIHAVAGENRIEIPDELQEHVSKSAMIQTTTSENKTTIPDERQELTLNSGMIYSNEIENKPMASRENQELVSNLAIKHEATGKNKTKVTDGPRELVSNSVMGYATTGKIKAKSLDERHELIPHSELAPTVNSNVDSNVDSKTTPS